MKKMTNFLILLLVCSLVFAGPAVIAADNGDVSESTTDYGIYTDAVEKLTLFGIMDTSSFDASRSITKGKFLDEAMRIMGSDAIFSQSESPFSDVAVSHPYCGAITAAANMGIVLGNGDGSFSPDIIITQTQAVKILMSILGYDYAAMAQGGYPSGYLSVAAANNLLKKTVISDNAECTEGAAAQLIYNALNVDVMQRETYPQESFKSVDGENPMTLWLGIEMLRGTVTASEITSYSMASGIADGYVRIDNETFLENNTGAKRLVGYPVKAYYDTDAAGIKRLVCVDVEKKVTVSAFSANDIEPSSTPNELICYEKSSNKLNKYKISASPKVFYNGKFYENPLTAELLKPEIGSVTLVDTNSDDIAELVIIEKSDIIVIDTISKNGMITDRFNGPDLKIDLNDTDIELDITLNGVKTDFSKLKEKNILTVTKSDNGVGKKYISIKATDSVYKGVVDEKSDKTITIDGEEFDIIESNRSFIMSAETGKTVLFYLTADEDVAGIEKSVAGSGAYGYLTIGSIAKNGIDTVSNATVRIFEFDSIVRQYKLSQTVRINGSRVDGNGEKYTPASALRAISVYPNRNTSRTDVTENVFCNQLIKYSLNSNNEITEIQTAVDNRLEVDKNLDIEVYHGTGEHIDDFSCDYSFRNDAWKCAFKSFGFLEGRYSIFKAVTLSMPLPQNKAACTATGSNEYISPWQKLYDGTGSLDECEKQISIVVPETDWENDYKLYYTDVYDVTDDRECNVVIEYKASGTSVVPGLEFMAVDKVVKGFDSDGLVADLVYGCYKGKYKALTLSSDIEINGVKKSAADVKLEPGDILRVAVSPTDELLGYYTIFTMDKERAADEGFLLSGAEYGIRGNSGNSDINCTWNKYDKTKDSDIHIIHSAMHVKADKLVSESQLNIDLGSREGSENPMGIRLLRPRSTTCYYVYDETTDRAYVGTIDDIDCTDPNQSIVVRDRYYEAYECIIINRKTDSEIYWNGTF